MPPQHPPTHTQTHTVYLQYRCWCEAMPVWESVSHSQGECVQTQLTLTEFGKHSASHPQEPSQRQRDEWAVPLPGCKYCLQAWLHQSRKEWRCLFAAYFWSLSLSLQRSRPNSCMIALLSPNVNVVHPGLYWLPKFEWLTAVAGFALIGYPLLFSMGENVSLPRVWAESVPIILASQRLFISFIYYLLYL